jgi:hypothetical protein
VADNYTPAGSSTTVRVLSSTQVIDVEAVAIYTRPSNVYVVVQVPLDDFKAGNSNQYLYVTADLIEGLLAASPDAGQQLVSSVTYVQDVDGSGLLAGFLAFTVVYQPRGRISAPFETTITLPVTSFESADAFNTPLPGGLPLVQITDAYENLKKLAAA